MRLHRFFVSSKIDKEKINTFSSPSLAHQLRSVFRFHEGSNLIFFDGSGSDFVSEIVSLSKDVVTFRVLETRAVKPLSKLYLTLALSLIKKDNVEWVIEKGTELGVARFAPFLSERSEKKGFNLDRAERIAIEASEQSGRSEVPAIEEVVSLADAIANARGTTVAFHTEGDGSEAFDRDALPRSGDLTVFIGPEGGWSPKEVELFKEKGVRLVKLPTPVLRAETAAIAVAAVLLI